MTVAVGIEPSTGSLRSRFDAALAGFLDDRAREWPDRVPGDLVASMRDVALSGGKRLRPTFCYWGWRGAGQDDAEEIVTAAAALELFHAFALIHDDIMDGSDLRRGRPAMHRTFAERHAQARRRGDPAEALSSLASAAVHRQG